jgi:hypothetical protein
MRHHFSTSSSHLDFWTRQRDLAASLSISQGFRGVDEHLCSWPRRPPWCVCNRSWKWLGYAPPPEARQPPSATAPCRRRDSLLSPARCAMVAAGATLPRRMPGRTQRRVDVLPAGSCRATGGRPCRPEQAPPPSGTRRATYRGRQSKVVLGVD